MVPAFRHCHYDSRVFTTHTSSATYGAKVAYSPVTLSVDASSPLATNSKCIAVELGEKLELTVTRTQPNRINEYALHGVRGHCDPRWDAPDMPSEMCTCDERVEAMYQMLGGWVRICRLVPTKSGPPRTGESGSRYKCSSALLSMCVPFARTGLVLRVHVNVIDERDGCAGRVWTHTLPE